MNIPPRHDKTRSNTPISPHLLVLLWRFLEPLVGLNVRSHGCVHLRFGLLDSLRTAVVAAQVAVGFQAQARRRICREHAGPGPIG